LGEIQVRIHVILVAETNFLPKIGWVPALFG
jgi:hypothetical protein